MHVYDTIYKEKKKAHSWTNIPNQVKNELDDAYEVESKVNVLASRNLHFQV